MDLDELLSYVDSLTPEEVETAYLQATMGDCITTCPHCDGNLLGSVDYPQSLLVEIHCNTCGYMWTVEKPNDPTA